MPTGAPFSVKLMVLPLSPLPPAVNVAVREDSVVPPYVPLAGATVSDVAAIEGTRRQSTVCVSLANVSVCVCDAYPGADTMMSTVLLLPWKLKFRLYVPFGRLVAVTA